MLVLTELRMEVLDPRGLFGGALKLAKACCMSPLYSRSGRLNALHRGYAVFLYSCMALHLAAELADLAANWGDITRVSQNLAFSIIVINNLSRSLIILLNQDTVKRVVKDANSFFRKEFVIEGEPRFTTHRWERGARLWSIVYGAGGACILAPIITTPILTSLLAASSEHDPLPVRALYPFDAAQGAGRLVAYVMQTFVLINGAIMLVVVDSFCITALALTCAQLELLRVEIRHIVVAANLMMPDPSKDRNLNSHLLRTGKETLLRKCAATHCNILNFIALMEKALCYVTIANSWVLTVCLVTTAFEIMKSEVLTIPRLFSIAILLETAIIFVMVYSLIGDKLIGEQEKLCRELYETEWLESSLLYRHTLLFMMQRAQRPKGITVGKIAVLNLETYVKEMNRAFSLFNAMLHLGKKE